MFIDAGAHYVALDFIAIGDANGDLRVMAKQVQRAIAWTYKNAASFDGDPDRLYIGDYEIIVQLIPSAANEAPAPQAPTVLKGLNTVDPLAALGGGAAEPAATATVDPASQQQLDRKSVV